MGLSDGGRPASAAARGLCAAGTELPVNAAIHQLFFMFRESRAHRMWEGGAALRVVQVTAVQLEQRKIRYLIAGSINQKRNK